MWTSVLTQCPHAPLNPSVHSPHWGVCLTVCDNSWVIQEWTSVLADHVCVFQPLEVWCLAPPPPPPALVPVCGCEAAGSAFCNYDYGAGVGGFCEPCSSVPGGAISGCVQMGLPDAGMRDCRRWCFAPSPPPPPPPRPPPPPPPRPSSPSHCTSMAAADHHQCVLSDAQAQQACACQYTWMDGCTAPTGVAVHCQ